MKLSQPVKILVGVATLLMFLFPLVFVGVWFLMMFSMFLGTIREELFLLTFFLPMMIIFPLQFLMLILQLGLKVFYLTHVIKNKTGSESARVILGLTVFYLPYIGMPIYYFMYIWPDQSPDLAPTPVLQPV